ncbi:MAG: prolipoprotein diacylglyceryl transferase [Spirochaetaceae bacterium]|nr:MAG: prolipoprotein diacylglyceryl transferase [Spirochaetaceae bacterium]
MFYIPFPTWLSAEIIPGLPLRWYGLMYLIAFALSYLLFMAQIRKRTEEIDQDTVMNFFFWGIIGLLIGARLFSTLLFDASGLYLRRPWLIFWPFYEGRFVGLQGMNYYGGLVGAIVGFVLYARRKSIDILDWGDMLVIGVPLGYTFGRLGNFINAELYGRVTQASWGVVFPTAARFPASEPWVQEWAAAVGMELQAGQTLVNLPRHPTQIYEAIAEGILLWVIMWFIVRKHKPYNGFAVGFYLIAYGVMRFAIDYFRMPISAADFAIRLVDNGIPVHFVQTPLNLIPSQLYSLAMIVGGAVFLSVVRRKSVAAAAAGSSATNESTRTRSSRALRKKIRS